MQNPHLDLQVARAAQDFGNMQAAMLDRLSKGSCLQGPFESTQDLLDAWDAEDLEICSAPMWASPGAGLLAASVP